VWKESCPEEDQKLAARSQEGDQFAFEELVRKYQQVVLNLAYHYIGRRDEIEDIAQKIFCKVYFSLPKFDIRRPFFPWLYRIAINQCYDELRRAKRQKVRTFSELSLEETSSIDKLISHNEIPPASIEDRQEMHALLHRMMDQLPEHQKMAVVLRDIEQIPYVKMAEILKCSEQAARLKVFRARIRLKTLMEKALQKRPKN
jgi:RNA polymerase sigma-70 factor, ECF subfamily